MKLLRKACVGLLAALAAGVTYATGIPVFDAGNFAKNLITATQAVKQVANQVTQISNQVTMIQNQLRSLKTLGEGRFTDLIWNLDNQVAQLNSILGTVNGVGYQISAVDGQFRTLFPDNADWASKPVSQYGDYFERWSAQLQDASRTAMKSQGVIDNLRRHNAEAQQILMQSKAADGEVRQLQAVNEMLSVLTNQFGDMTIAVTTSGRVSASAAAAAQAERDAQREIVRRFTAPVTVPTNEGERF